MKEYLLKVQHAIAGQPAIWRSPSSTRIKAADEGAAARRALRAYKKEHCRGKRKPQYQITITPL